MVDKMLVKLFISKFNISQDRFLSIRELLHLMGMPHTFAIDNVNNFNHICQVMVVMMDMYM